MHNKMKQFFILMFFVLFILSGCNQSETTSYYASIDEIPEYSGTPYIAINNNEPEFTEKEITGRSFEKYSKLDRLGRCGVAVASVGKDIMPTEKRSSISQIKPSGWQSVRYDFVDGKSLYNRCHLIGYQLTGENANEKNLITGTRYMNVEGMLPFEDMVADYVKETDNHVMYRVTPVFQGDEIVARGVQMEGYSVEDEGEGISFNVYCYNVQPQIMIDYATGNSKLDNNESFVEESTKTEQTKNSSMVYVLNMNTQKFHLPGCSSVSNIHKENRGEYKGTREELIEQGYEPCGVCKP